MSELVVTMDERMKALNEQSMKLEKMMLHLTHEQERHFEPGRHEHLRKMKGLYHSSSEPNLTELVSGVEVRQDNI